GAVAPGTASPAYNAGKTLEIGGSDSTDPGLFLRDAGTAATGLDIWLDTSGAHGYFDSRFNSDSIRAFNFRTKTAGTPVNALTILGSGNVGIGTTNPTQKLHIAGNCVTFDTILPIRRKKKKKKGEKKGDGDGDDDYDYLTLPISDVLAGDEVLSLDESTAELKYSRINRLIDMGLKEVYEVTLKSGRIIKTTSEHPFLTIQNYL
ncbi:MAG: Hint domain-containing protein, partial [Patescibacteria group bacterium]|nr:Hint domain-containing protein [Patescibacteria group bacterium]